MLDIVIVYTVKLKNEKERVKCKGCMVCIYVNDV